jgi:hypothetical protein
MWLLCTLLAVPPSSYYYHPQGGDDLSLLAAIEHILDEHLPMATVELRRNSIGWANSSTTNEYSTSWSRTICCRCCLRVERLPTVGMGSRAIRIRLQG